MKQKRSWRSWGFLGRWDEYIPKKKQIETARFLYWSIDWWDSNKQNMNLTVCWKMIDIKIDQPKKAKEKKKSKVWFKLNKAPPPPPLMRPRSRGLSLVMNSKILVCIWKLVVPFINKSLVNVKIRWCFVCRFCATTLLCMLNQIVRRWVTSASMDYKLFQSFIFWVGG